MPLTWVREESWMDGLAAEWNDLLARSPSDYPFLRIEYLTAWWRHLGGGEWKSGDARLALWREDGALRGIAPLFRANGEPRLLLIGSREISDYLDVIAARGDHEEFCRVLTDALAEMPEGDWRTLDVCNLHPGSPTIPALEAAAARHGWACERSDLEKCPVIALPRTWEAYLESLDGKTRHEIRRKLRRGENGEHKIALRLTEGGRLADDLEAFFRLMAANSDKAAFLSGSMRSLFGEIAQAAREAGILQLAFLDVDGIPAAGYFNFDYGGRIWVYNSGMDPAYAALSPGWVLLGLLIRRAIEQGCRTFDFMRGDEAYKFHWGGTSETLRQLTIRRA